MNDDIESYLDYIADIKNLLDEKLAAEKKSLELKDSDYEDFMRLAFEIQVLENYLFTNNLVESIIERYQIDMDYQMRDIQGLSH